MTLRSVFFALFSILFYTAAAQRNDSAIQRGEGEKPTFNNSEDGRVAYKPGKDFLPFVNPFVGTGGHGHTYPGAAAPFGMVQLSPDTRISMMDWDGCSGYHYSDSIIYGFSHTHLSGTGVPDYCDILVTPVSGKTGFQPAEYASSFKKSSEKAEPGYYAVTLDKGGILCEMTATERTGVHQYTFKQGEKDAKLLFDLRHRDETMEAHIEQINDREIAGYRISKAWAKEQHVYFVARFSKPIDKARIYDMSTGEKEAGKSLTGKSVLALFDFDVRNNPLIVTVGISGVSIDGARRNLDAESNHFEFELIKRQTQRKWQAKLGQVEVETGVHAYKYIFYTAFYHTMLSPNIWNDVDGQYRGRDNKIHQAKGHDVYTVFSLWDTYRAANPLYSIFEPQRTNDFIQTFLRQYEQSGLLPMWELSANETDCMIGNHAIPVIADAWAKGIRDYDLDLALKAMRANAESDRYGLGAYRRYGFVPSDLESESVSKTLEYAYDDWCVAQIAGAAGKDDVRKQYLQRAQYYKNLYDPSTGFFRARKNNSRHTPFDPWEVNFNYTEANAWQYRFAAPQDISGLIKLMGGQKGFVARLDSLFTAADKTTGRNQADITGLIGQYVHGNEPSHHMAYLYIYAGKPWKTQQRVRQIMDAMYSNQPDGLSGNEDCGQMSAWYVLSAMGFYPVCPGSPIYTVGTPLFDRVTLHLPNKKKLIINAAGTSTKEYYIRSLRVNGELWPNSWISHEQLLSGGTFDFDMVGRPAPWGSEEGYFPVQKIDAPEIVPVPFVASGERSFRDRQQISLACADTGAVLYYTLDQTEPGAASPRYSGPFEISEACTLKMIAVKGGEKSAVVEAIFSKMQSGLRVDRYIGAYTKPYAAAGDESLIDGIRGGADFRTGDWQGFEGKNFDVVIDLGEKRSVQSVEAGFLQDENSWIFFPSSVQVSISNDGREFKPAGEIRCDIPPAEKGALLKNFTIPVEGKKARYVRVTGVSLLKCPEGHKGAGYPCWVFADEVIVK